MSAVAHAAPQARWRPAPLVTGSIALHGVAFLGAVLGPEEWIWWALSAVAANQAGLTALGMWPRSTLLGPNFTRLPGASAARGEIAFTFDDGPDAEVTPQVLDILDAFNVRATFFCIAEKARGNPELCREIARRGHIVENHSSGHHATFAMLGLRGIRREITEAQRMLGEITGRSPRFFRPPAGLRNPLLDPVLHDLNLRLVSWTRRGYDTQRSNDEGVTRRLLRGLAAGDILLLHDGHSARTPDGKHVVLAVLPRLIEAAHQRGLHPVTLDQAIDP
ncbi:MAG: polysaccharide deacetylase family protein [Usitatibacter sp.]